MPPSNPSIERVRTVHGVEVPTFLYGTAWKEDRTENLVREALAAGFRGLDTANQRRHYHEAGVGRALARAFEDGTLSRDDVFLQTKFTHVAGQDHRLPYGPRDPVAEQVAQSFRSSLEHLGVERIDSYVLHGPSQRPGLADADREAWRAMETVHGDGGTRLLGVSNVTAEQLETLCELASVKPAFVQNRCFARAGWDAAVRRVCERRDVVYQGFSLLTANPEVVGHPALRAVAGRHGATVPQIVFAFAIAIGIVPLTGTTDPRHMVEDLAVYEIGLTDEEVREIAALSP